MISNVNISLTLLSLAAIATAKVFRLPDCGLPCIDYGYHKTTCPDQDYACLCIDAAFITGVAECLAFNCASDEQDTQATIGWADSVCNLKTGVRIKTAMQSALQDVRAATTSAAAKTDDL